MATTIVYAPCSLQKQVTRICYHFGACWPQFGAQNCLIWHIHWSFTSISERSSPCSRESITSELRLPVSCIYSTSNGRKIPLNKYTDFEMFLNGHGPHRHSAEAMTSTKQKNVCSCIRTMPMLSPVQRTHTQSSLCWVINEWNMLLALTKWDIFGRVNAIFAPGPWLRTSIDSRFFSCTFSIYSRRSVMANAMDKNWI